MEEKSRRPLCIRKLLSDAELVEDVLELRERYPRWGKEKLCLLLEGAGWQTSSSAVGRILVDLKRGGVLYESPGGW